MSFNEDRVKQALRSFSFEDLFIDELGWDLARNIQPLQEETEEEAFIFSPIAEKRGLVVFLCKVSDDFPPHAMRKKLDSRIAKTYREHFIIFVDKGKTRQLWQWVWREPGRPLISRTHEYRPEQPGESLIQKLETIAFTLEEEDNLNIVEVSGRLRAAFNVERATRRFYDYFKKERTAFENFISGIESIETKQEYVSVMLNRLMFIYFIQRKGFLDGDTNYLRNRMARTKENYGDDQFYSFYRYFLLRLFHEALGGLERNLELEELIGDVPYLNGGIFELHQIEKDNPDIQIPDEAFERVLDFFDQYQWHLDDRPLRADSEINPDVLGYIFEKYINQKQMGAYYTKEDITEYISKNTIIPYLFDAARKTYPKAFKGEDTFWLLLEADPRRYIYEAVQKGVDLPLPEEIAVGIDDVSKREKWNTRTPEEFALPTEIWRETVARRQRYEEVRAKLERGEIKEINDLITHNLDMRQFAQDVIETCDKPETLRAFWKAIRSVTILDPTCGSGAFLFAALNILHPLYEACLDRMQTFIDEYPEEAPAHALRDFKDTLANVSRHPNEDYYILKSIIVDNLYGVDIMAEAVEIAKLRLFLKLAAQVSPDRNKENWGIEPLPDIDFNIRTGNTLVGFASREDVEKAFREGKGKVGGPQDKLFLMEDEQVILEEIEEQASDIDRLYNRFRDLQTSYDISTYSEDFLETKAELTKRLQVLGNELDKALAKQYGIDEKNTQTFLKWQNSHKPFHWFIEFFGIINQGGFEIVIGNPPYVEYRNVTGDYKIINFKTEDAGNLYAYILERTWDISTEAGKIGMIVPLSGHSTNRMLPLVENFYERVSPLYIINISADAHPSVLFPGVRFRLAIFLTGGKGESENYYSTKYTRWLSSERENLFSTINYTLVNLKINRSLLKINSKEHLKILKKVKDRTGSIGLHSGNHSIYFHNTPIHWIRAHSFAPYFKSERDGIKLSSQMKLLNFRDENIALSTTGLICSSIFFIWWISISDCYHLINQDVFSFPDDFMNNSEIVLKMAKITQLLEKDLKKNSKRRVYNYQTSGRVEYDEFYLKLSKPLIDELDILLQSHFNFTDEELDFIINFEIKYRMGDILFDDEDGDNDS